MVDLSLWSVEVGGLWKIWLSGRHPVTMLNFELERLSVWMDWYYKISSQIKLYNTHPDKTAGQRASVCGSWLKMSSAAWFRLFWATDFKETRYATFFSAAIDFSPVTKKLVTLLLISLSCYSTTLPKIHFHVSARLWHSIKPFMCTHTGINPCLNV